MNLSGSAGSGVDLELQNFIEKESQKTRFKLLVSGLTDKCWDACVKKINPSLKSKTEGCITNCVERFMDTTSFVINRLNETQASRSSFSSD